MAKKVKRPGKTPLVFAPTAKGKKAEAGWKQSHEVAGPKRSQSSVPSIRKKATPKEHRVVSASPQDRREAGADSPLLVPSLPKAIERKQRSLKQETQRKIKRLRALDTLKDKALTTLRETKLPPEPHTIYQQARYGGIAPPKSELAKFPKVYERAKLAELSGKENLKEPEDLTTAITTVAPGGFAAGQIVKGVAKYGVKEIGEQALTQLAGKAESAAIKVAAKKEIPKATSRVVRNVGRRVTRKPTIKKPPKVEPQFSAQVPGTAALKATAGQTLPVVRGHEQAIVDNPKKTAETTLRALPGLITVPVGIAAHAGTSAGRAGSEALHEAGVPGFRGYSSKEILAPLKYEGKAQLDFAKEVAKVVTSNDPGYVQKEVEDNLGLLLPIAGGLAGKAVADRFAAQRITTRVRKLAEKARRNPHGDIHGVPRVFEKSGQRKAEAREASIARLRIKREFADRSRKVTREGVRAEGKTVLRQLPKTKRFARQKELAVHTGDAVPFLVRNAIDISKPKAAMAEIKRIRAQLGKADRPLPEGELHTREVLDHLIADPTRLEDRHLQAAVDAARGQERYARETPGLSPDHSEAARYSSVAVQNKIAHASERFPARIKPFMRAGEKVGQDARKAVLKEAHSDARSAKGFLRKAATLEKRSAVMRRELAIRERMNQGQLGLGALPKAHDALRARIDRLDLQAAHLKERARHAEEIATHKREVARDMRNDPGTWKELEGAMVSDVKGHIDKTEGLTEPEYAYTGFTHGLPTQSTGSYARIPGKSKRKTGRAEAMGAVREGLGPYVAESIGKPIARRHIFAALRGFLDRNQVRAGGKTVFSGDEARELFENPDSGITPKSHVAVPTQLTNRAFDFVKKDSTDLHPGDDWVAQMRALVQEHEQSLAGLDKGTKYHLVRRPASEEFFAQMTSARMSKVASQINRGTSYLILATSPAWAVMQVAAEFAQAAAAEPRILNPKNVQRYVQAYHDMAPHKRQELEAWTGVTTRNIEHANDVKLGLDVASDMAGADTAFGVFNRTPGGRLIRSIPQSIRNIDQWKGGRIRVLTAVAKIDRDMNGKLNGFLHGIGNLYREQMRISKQLKGQPLSKQLDYWADHPKAVERYGTYLDDMLGNWTALTQNERVASQLVIFYPFLRMSLRWTFKAFPEHHPLRAAAGYWLGQQNANELKKLLHGDPSFFTQWGNVPLHLGPGETQQLDLSRIAPGSNAVVEALGGSNAPEGPWGAKALRIAQPGLSALVAGGLGVNPLTGKQEPHSAAQGVNAVASLSPISREAEKVIVPSGRKRAEGSIELFGSTERQNSLDRLFAKLRGSETTQAVRGLLMPAVPKNVEHEADIAKLGRILGKLSKNSSTKRKERAADLASGSTPKAKAEAEVAGMKVAYDKANGELDGLFKKYKVPYKAEEKRFFGRYGDIYYGQPESESSSGSWRSSGSTSEGWRDSGTSSGGWR